jgi:mRNA-degrading endonuclease toxin of MazEF toxin-antitoxin module
MDEPCGAGAAAWLADPFSGAACGQSERLGAGQRADRTKTSTEASAVSFMWGARMRVHDTYRERLAGWYPRQGEVYSCQLDKVRPAIIVSPDNQNKSRASAFVVPLTSQNSDYGRSFALSAVDCGLRTRSWAKIDAMQELDHDAIIDNPIGKLSGSRLADLLSRLPRLSWS